MIKCIKMLAALGLAFGALSGHAQTLGAQQNSFTADQLASRTIHRPRSLAHWLAQASWVSTTKTLDEATAKGRTVVDMKKD